MYYSKSKVYTPSKQSLDQVPLEDFLDDYNEAKALVNSSYDNRYSLLLEKERESFLAKWNSSNETSYEGSMDELGLESKVRAKLGNRPDLRSDPRVIEVFDSFATRYGIAKNASWFFSQALAKFATLPLVKNANGYSAKSLFLDHISKNPKLLALYFICMYQKRSTFLDKQTSPEHRNFSSLVPLIMSAFKKLNNIPYASWDKSEIHGIVEPNLYAAMSLTELPELSKEDVLAERELALTVKTGDKAGSVRSPVTTYSLYFSADSPLAALPALARIMLCQTWCAHPSNRTEYMILNPLDWDDTPEPLVTGDVFVKHSTTTVQTNDIPWV